MYKMYFGTNTKREEGGGGSASLAITIFAFLCVVIPMRCTM